MGIDSKHVHFIFKGGNVMRFVMMNMMRKASKIKEKVEKNYMDVFKPSDLDFGIVFDFNYISSGLNSEKVHELTDLLETKMLELRDLMMEGHELFLPGIMKSETLLHDILMRYFVQVQETIQKNNQSEDTFQLPVIKSIESLGVGNAANSSNYLTDRGDLDIYFKNEPENIQHLKMRENEKVTRTICESELKNALYVSKNKSLFFMRDEDVFLHFDLLRIKLVFKLHSDNSTKLIGGEIIDLSVQHPGAAEQKPPIFTRYGRYSSSYSYETYSVQTSKNKYSVESYNLHGLIFDIVRILFIEQFSPWKDSKYEKRLKRLMGLLLCEAVVELSHGVSLKKVTELMKMCTDPSPSPVSSDTEETIWTFVHSYIQRIDMNFGGGDEVMKIFRNILVTYTNLNIKLLSSLSNETLKPIDLYTYNAI
jgi:hypothetical protein